MKKAREEISKNMKMPITFKEFSRDPVKGLLFIVLLAIGYLYVDGKMTNKEIIAKQSIRIEKLESKVETLTAALQKVSGEAAAVNARMELMEQLGKLPK